MKSLPTLASVSNKLQCRNMKTVYWSENKKLDEGWVGVSEKEINE